MEESYSRYGLINDLPPSLRFRDKRLWAIENESRCEFRTHTLKWRGSSISRIGIGRKFLVLRIHDRLTKADLGHVLTGAHFQVRRDHVRARYYVRR